MTKIALNIYEINKGDILLTSMTDELSLEIQKLTNSLYTHACLYLGNASFIEATLGGVNYFSPLYFIFDDIRSLKVLRLDYSKYGNIEDILTGVEFAAREFSFRKYAQLNAIKAGKLKEAEKFGKEIIETVDILDGWEKSIHCSQLVSLSYNIGGKINLVGNKKPENVTPADLEKSNLLLDVTEKVTFQIAETSNLKAKSYPLSPENSILTKQTIISQQALVALEETFKKISIPLPPDIWLVIQLLNNIEREKAIILDDNLDKILNELGFYSLLLIYIEDYDKHIDDKIETIKEKIVVGTISGANYRSYLDMLDYGIMVSKNTLNKQRQNLFTSRINYINTKFKTYKSLHGMYLNFFKFLTKTFSEKLNAYECILNNFEKEEHDK